MACLVLRLGVDARTGRLRCSLLRRHVDPGRCALGLFIMIGVSAVIAVAVLFFAVLLVDTRAHGRRAVALLAAIRRELEVYPRPTPANAAGFRYMPGGD